MKSNFYAGLPIISTDEIPNDCIVERTQIFRAMQIGHPFVCYTRSGEMVIGNDGDYVIVGIDGWPEVVSQVQFKEQFRKVDANNRKG